MFLFIIMSKRADTEANNTTWSTWEELLLAFAVKRHGLKDWDTVAMELQNRHRTSMPSALFTPQLCKDRYRYLRQRFKNPQLHPHRNNNASAAGGPPGGEVGTANHDLSSALDSDAEDNTDVLGDAESLPWLEELRKIRVAELKREVQRYDVSIKSLQMRVKTMEEEREKSSSENQNGAVKEPDLDEEMKEERSENDKKDADGDSREEAAGKTVSAEDENRSFNESNSTENRRCDIKIEPEPEREPVELKPDSDAKPPVGEEDSCNDSSDRHEVGKASRKRDKDGVDSDELRDSVSDSKEEGTKESSDVQSSASLMTRKRRRMGDVHGSNGGGGSSGGTDGATVVSPATAPIKRESGGSVKSEPLVGFLENIRSHKHGSVFERRLESQKTENYGNMIRQHVDLETVQARIDDGSYTSCPTRFYVDLLLLFNNAIVFFPKSSPESVAAQELRQVVKNELNKKSTTVKDSLPIKTQLNNKITTVKQSSPVKVQPKAEPDKPDSLLAQHNKSTAPLIVCRKRSSIQAKASSSSVNKVEKQGEDKPVSSLKPPIKSPLSTSNEEDNSSMKLKMKEKPITGVRSMRRSSKGRPNPQSAPPPSSQNPSASAQQPAGTADKSQATAAAAAAKADNKKKAEESANVKKRGAADFLKRIKKNDHSKTGTLVEALKSSGDNFKGSGNKRDHQPQTTSKKSEEKKDVQAKRGSGGNGNGNGNGGGVKHKEESSPSKRSVGRPPKKGKESAVGPGKRGRESGEGEDSSKRSKKRSRK